MFDFSRATPEESYRLLLMKLQKLFGLVVESGLTMFVRESLKACLQTVLVFV